MKRVLIAAAVWLLASSSMASAEPRAGLEVNFGIGGGMSIPLLDAHDALKNGFNGQGFLRLGLGRVPVALRAGLHYQNFDLRRPLEVAGITRGGTHTLLGGLADLQLLLPGRRLRPYLLACGGAYSRKTELDGDDGPTSTDTRFTAGGGAGVEVAFEGLRIFVEGRVDHVFTDAGDPFGDRGLDVAPVAVGFVF
jgi:hypothetical protein